MMTVRILGLLVAGVFLMGCDKDDDNDMSSKSRIMVVHASPNAPNVDVRVNNTVALTNVP